MLPTNTEKVAWLVCLSVLVLVCRCVPFGSTHVIFTKCFVYVTQSHGLVLLWRHCNMLYTSSVFTLLIGHQESIQPVKIELWGVGVVICLE